MTVQLVCKQCGKEHPIDYSGVTRDDLGAVVSQLRLKCYCGGKLLLPHGS